MCHKRKEDICSLTVPIDRQERGEPLQQQRNLEKIDSQGSGLRSNMCMHSSLFELSQQ